jgi:hypothetical protein
MKRFQGAATYKILGISALYIIYNKLYRRFRIGNSYNIEHGKTEHITKETNIAKGRSNHEYKIKIHFYLHNKLNLLQSDDQSHSL